MIGSRFTSLLLIVSAAAAATAFHDGDNIYGGVNGQAVIVDPTNAATTPRTYVMTYVPGVGSGQFIADVGFDVWDLGGGISELQTSRLNGRILSYGLKARDNLRYFFAPDWYYSQPTGATNVRQFFTLSGTSRHKHFSFYVDNVGARRTYDFEFWFTNATDTLGNSLANSPIYRLRFEVNPVLNPAPNPSPVPEPASMFVLGTGIAAMIHRRRR